MKKSVILLCMAFMLNMLTISVFAQSNKRMDVAEFEKKKMEYIQKEAGLTQQEASSYFPLNGELSKKKFELYKRHRDKVQKIKDNSKNMSEAEYRRLLENDMEVKQKETALEKEYAEKFEKVLSPEKLYRAQQAEKSFMQQAVMNFRDERKK